MGEYLIKGGARLSGEITPGGAKNAILPILSAVILNRGISVIHNVPAITDVFLTLDILKSLGCTVTFKDGVVTVNSSNITNTDVPIEPVKLMRSSTLFLGSMLGSIGKITIAMPGGCKIGDRKIDFHLKALRAMGATIRHDKKNDMLICSVKEGKLVNTHHTLKSPSVGATENIIMAAVLTKGETVIQNAAKEPEIVDLADFLNKSGAKISGAGTKTVVINGVNKLKKVTHTIIPDRIVGGTYLCAAAMTGGDILLTGILPQHIRPIYRMLEDAGCTVKTGENYCWLRSPERLQSLDKIVTEPHPGFPYCNKGRYSQKIIKIKVLLIFINNYFINYCFYPVVFLFDRIFITKQCIYEGFGSLFKNHNFVICVSITG